MHRKEEDKGVNEENDSRGKMGGYRATLYMQKEMEHLGIERALPLCLQVLNCKFV